MKFRQFLLIVALSAALRVSIASAELAAVALPLVPACLVGLTLCGATGYFLTRTIWKFIYR